MSVGDDHGKLRIFFHNMQSNEYITKGDYQLLTGPINAITWTDDSQRVAIAGDGKDAFSKAIAWDTGSKVGDVIGPTKQILALDIKKRPFRMVTGGENMEIYVYDGVPFKLK